MFNKLKSSRLFLHTVIAIVVVTVIANYVYMFHYAGQDTFLAPKLATDILKTNFPSETHGKTPEELDYLSYLTNGQQYNHSKPDLVLQTPRRPPPIKDPKFNLPQCDKFNASDFDNAYSQLSRYGLGAEPMIKSADVSKMFKTIPAGSALIRIRKGTAVIAGKLPNTYPMVTEIFKAQLKPLMPHLPDMDFILNGWDENIILPHHASLDDFFEKMPVTTKFHDSYFQALLKSPRCEGASEEFHKRRNLHVYFAQSSSRERPKIHGIPTVPVFSLTNIENCYWDIVIPAWHQTKMFDHDEEYVPWHKKQDVLFWRGAATGSLRETTELYYKGLRIRFIAFAKQYNEWHNIQNDSAIRIDAEITTHQKEVMKGPDRDRILKEYPLGSFVSLEKQGQFKYLIQVDGWTFNARLFRALHFGSLIFRVNIFSEFFEGLIKPWVHYIPIRLDFADLQDKLAWAQSHQDEAQRIADRGRAMATKYLNKDFHQCYMFRMLQAYSTMYDSSGD